MTNFWHSRYAARTASLGSSAIRELLQLIDQPDMISFAGGLPAPGSFPIAECKAACERVLAAHGAQALQYSSTEGFLPLREMLVRHMARYGIETTPEGVLVTSGAQQALDLVGKLFLDPGDAVVVEDPTYLGAIQAWRAYQPRFVPVPLDEDGIRIDLLEETLRRHNPKLLYIMPNFQNPTGVTLSELRRQRIVELATRHRVLIIEDDPYAQLRFEGDHHAPLHVLDAERARLGARQGDLERHVLYVGSFSKLVAPGLRVGWITGPDPIVSSLVQMKQGTDLHTGTLSQMLAYEACRGGFLDRHVRALRPVYAERRNTMLTALQEHMPPGVRWTRPEGGLFLWVTLPPAIETQALLEKALERQVAFVPGASFHAAGGGGNTMRLNFSYCDPGQITAGIARLSRVVEDALAAAHSPVI